MLSLLNFLIFLLFFSLFKSNSTTDEQNEKKVQEIDEDDAKVNLALNNKNLKSNKKIVFMVEWLIVRNVLHATLFRCISMRISG